MIRPPTARILDLIQQHNDVPSVYHAHGEPRRYGFHHWARLTPTLDLDLERYLALGYEVAFSDRVPSGGRVVYVDSAGRLPGMIELVDLTEALEQDFGRIYEASLGWDGTDPIRED